MAGNVANPRIWGLLDVYDAPVGTTAPTDVATALAAPWKAIGLISEDGLTISSDKDVQEHYAYGGILYRVTSSKHKKTFALTPLEDNPTVFALRNPGSTAVTTAGVTTRTLKLPTPNPRAFIAESVDGLVKRRWLIPRGEVIEVGDYAMSDSEAAASELTLVAYAAADLTYAIEITNDPQAVVV